VSFDAYREHNRTRQQIKQSGAISNLNEGIEITTHGLRTRLIAWPGNGFQTQSVHVLTLAPGDESETYTYDMAEEAMVCLKGRGEVFLRGRWVEITPGDIAYFPERTSHAVRNPAGNDRDLVVVTQIAPPVFDLYAPAGLYDQQKGAMDDEAIAAAKSAAQPGNLASDDEMRLSETHPELRAWNMSIDEIRREGALFNVYKGAAFGGLDVPMVLVLWPGYGVRSTGFHFGRMDAGQVAHLHTHPVSDEAVINWAGGSEVYVDGAWVPTGPLDVSLAPCGVVHGGRVPPDATEPFLPGGFAAPPQLDLYLNTPFHHAGQFDEPPWSTLDDAVAMS
jgi:gentisate 1,2-dioxygenase